ncbi:hypothetical protein QR680_007588 [Steinernema hermaphroditum]|uniref:Nicotinamide/nicotinic acid mononucleotide adenylyltransferase 3 n=1 Tax=Steinernema hermaphroditum TaxID=289476 RepID=A0AA39M6M5_9BILA|nr:hypothetical protein QR680_007588 [Steinernema hermaphroditum]
MAAFREAKPLPGLETEKTDVAPYTWKEYFESRPSTSSEDFCAPDVVPVDSFSPALPFHRVLRKLRQNPSLGLIVETSLDEAGKNKRWFAKVVQLAGYRCKLRLLLVEPLAPVEFWVNWASMDVQPIGKFEERETKLAPPVGSALAKKTKTEVKSEIVKLLINRAVLSQAVYDDEIKVLKTRRLRINQRVEILNTASTTEVRPAIVKSVIGNRIWLSLATQDMDPLDASDSQLIGGIYFNAESPLIYPVGWAFKMGFGIAANDSYVAHCKQIFEEEKKGRVPSYDANDARPEQLTPHGSSDFKPVGAWKAGDCLEVLDPLDDDFKSLRAAYVKKVLADGYLEIAFEGGSANEVLPIHCTSTHLFPPGYAEKYGIELEKPKKYRGMVFTWERQIQMWKKGKRFYPSKRLFRPVPPEEVIAEKFPIGAKLEATDQADVQRVICPASVKAIKGRLLLIAYDGWTSSYDQYFDYQSPDLMPLGWCEMVGHFLVPPAEESVENSRNPSEAAPSPAPAKSTRISTPIPSPSSPTTTTSTSPADKRTPTSSSADNGAPPAKKPRGRPPSDASMKNRTRSRIKKMTAPSLFNGCRRVVLIACGSFNPPTVMHMRMFECTRDYLQQKLGVTVVEGILSPTADNYKKPDLAKATDRLRMCELATKGSDWLRADGWECSQEGWTRTLAVLKHYLPLLKKKYGGAGDADDLAVVFLCGGDLVDTFTVITPSGEPLWNPQDIRTIIGDFGLVIFDRASSKPKETLEAIGLAHLLGSTVHFTSDVAFPNDVSSTNLRKAVRNGLSIKYCTPDLVCDYIKEHKLYQQH